jgi:hypothetical protein
MSIQKMNSLSPNYSAASKQVSFGATPKEIKSLTMTLLKKDPEAGKVLAYLVNSSNNYPSTKKFLDCLSTKDIKRAVKEMVSFKKSLIDSTEDGFRKLRQGINESIERSYRFLNSPELKCAEIMTPKNQNLVKSSIVNMTVKKLKLVEAFMPKSYRIDTIDKALELCDKASPSVMANHRINKEIHRTIDEQLKKATLQKMAENVQV